MSSKHALEEKVNEQGSLFAQHADQMQKELKQQTSFVSCAAKLLLFCQRRQTAVEKFWRSKLIFLCYVDF